MAYKATTYDAYIISIISLVITIIAFFVSGLYP